MKKYSAFICILALLLTFGLAGRVSFAASKDDVDKKIQSLPAEWPEAPEIPAACALLMDADSGEILYAKNATEAAYPASTTKLMTALLTLEKASLTDTVPFSFQAVNIPAGSSHIGMRRNEQMNLKECLYALLLPSANEVANALAEHTGGTIAEFVARMNQRMMELGGVNSSFINANGLHNVNHYTCAYDLALVMQACIQNGTFVEIASALSYVHHSDALLAKDIPMTNTNQMIRPTSPYYNAYAICGKTGHTDESGQNLVMYGEKEGTRLISVVLGCEEGQQYVSTDALFNYGFLSFHTVLPAEEDDTLDLNNEYTLSKLQIPTPGRSLLSLEKTDSILLPATISFDSLEKTYQETPKGRVIVYSYKGYTIGSVSLTYASDEEQPAILEGDYTEWKEKTIDNMITIDGFLLLVLFGLAGAAAVTVVIIRRYLLPSDRLRR